MKYYNVETDIKLKIRKAGFVTRDIAKTLNEPPNTTSHRLNGYLPLSDKQRKQILDFIKQSN